ncbi:MAG: hypothetical protein ACRDQX_12175 [Pseudonocardiaceae bacterium]
MVTACPLVVIPFGQRWVGAVPAVRVIAVSALPVLLTFVALSALIARHQLRLVAAGCAAGTVIGVAVSLVLFSWHPDALSAVIGTSAGATVVAAVFLGGLRDLFTDSHPRGTERVRSDVGAGDPS